MIFEPFRPEHLSMLAPQEAQRIQFRWMTPEIASLASGHFSFTGVNDGGDLVGCAGLAPLPNGVLIAWAVFTSRIETHALAVTRAVKRGLDMHAGQRIEAHVSPEHPKASAFAERLSFKLLETRADLHPSGAPLHVYVRERA